MPEIPRAHKLLKGFDSRKLENAELHSWLYWTGSVLNNLNQKNVFLQQAYLNRILKADTYLDSGQQFIEHEKSQQKSLPSFDLKEFISVQDRIHITI